MNPRVKAVALCLALASVISGGAAAFADDEDHPAPGATAPATGFPSKIHRPHPEENELHDRYGDDVGQVNLPPLIVKQQPSTGAASTGKAETLKITPPKAKLVDAGNADPVANVPVDPKQINPEEGTPADSFFNAANVGLGVMGIGVVALAVMAVRRSARLRKDPKADFLYQ